MHSKKSILLHNGSPWVKKDNDGMFDVTMGTFDGAEVCELVGLFILNDLANKYGTNVVRSAPCQNLKLLFITKSS